MDRVTCREYDFSVAPFSEGYKLIPQCRSFLVRKIVDNDGENRTLKIQLGKIEDGEIEYISAENGLNLFVGSFFDIVRYRNDSEYVLNVKFLVSPDILESSSVVSTSGGGVVKVENSVDENGNPIPLVVSETVESAPWNFYFLNVNNNGTLLVPEILDSAVDDIQRYIINVRTSSNVIKIKIKFARPFLADKSSLIKYLYIDSVLGTVPKWESALHYNLFSSNYYGIKYPLPNKAYVGTGIFSELDFAYTANSTQIDNGIFSFIF